MFRVTLKVLVFRYAYTVRQRWVLTSSYLLFPLIMCLLAVASYDLAKFDTYGSHIEEHHERSLLRLPEHKTCSRQNDCQLKIVVCPDGAKERELMNTVASMLRLSDNTGGLDITYVRSADDMDDALLRSPMNYSRGLRFLEISRTKLEYTIRPRALPVPAILYDWGDHATARRFPSPMYRGPRLTDPYFNVDDGVLFLAGFLPLQVAVDKAYINTYFPNVSKEWILTSFPYPPYSELPMQARQVLSHRAYLMYVQYMLMMGITFMILVFASYTISEKMSGIREWMCVNGAIRWMVNLSWLISFCFEATILAIVEMIILKMSTRNGPTVTYMSASVLTSVLIIHNWVSLCWVHVLASFLQSKILCIVITAAYWIFSPVLYWIPPDRFALQGLLATLPNAGLVLIFKSFQEFDGAETVLDFSRIFTHPIHYLPLSVLLLIMLFTSVPLILLSIYANLVSPGPFGIAKPWNLLEKTDKDQDDAGHDKYPNDERHFEEISHKDPISLECVRISKLFRTRKIPWWRFHTAVTNVSMMIPENKITVLLGPNGSGKTALFSMLCGMYSPSSGHFYAEDYDVFEGDNIQKFQKDLGYCPQHNLLMNELTVRQHLIIFGLLKGLSRKEAEENSEYWTKRLEIEKFKNTKVKELSPGIKRKLCLAIALTGYPLYLLLDEPSSGLDAESCRTVWNILLHEKSYCTVILTTHDMNEAEVLGDRIALLVNGQLVGYGSSPFLKKQLEAGYKLNCTINEKDRKRVLRFVENFDRSISVLYETRNAVTFGVPLNKAKVMPNLLKSMESEFGKDITTSLSHPTLDDVLIKFHSGARTGTGSSPNDVDVLEINEDEIDSSSNCGQIKEIFKKRFEWIFNQSLITLIILLLIFPIIAIESAVYFANRMIGSGISSTPHSDGLKLAMDAYSGKTAFIIKREDGITTALKGAMKTSGITYEEVHDDMVDFLKGLAEKDLLQFRSQMVFAFDSGDKGSDATAYYSRNAFHSAPIAYSALMNAILHGKGSITTHNFPFVKEDKKKTCLGVLPELVAFLFLIFLGPMLLISGAYFVIFPHVERRTLFKHLQLMTGLLPWVYWISHLMFDMLIFSLSILLIIIILAAADIGLTSNATVMWALIIVLLLYGISIIIFAYACSFCRCSTSIVVILFIFVPLLILLGHTIAVLLFTFSYPLDIKKLYFLPWVILMKSLWKISTWAGERKACYKCKDTQACAFISPYSLMGWLKPELTGFVIMSLVYFTFILAMDHGFGRKLKPMFDRAFYGGIKHSKGDTDPEVAKEKQRVKYLSKDREVDQPVLICDGLGKKYSQKVAAVRDVTFAHEGGSLFGLLGVEGSGKSTTLGMLAGVISPTNGSATVESKWDLGDCEYKYIRNIGFCPQFGGLLPGLSGRSTLRLFAHLRGLKPLKLRDSHVEKWIQALDMESLADRPCEQYSTGIKKKLSFAIAMIGTPSVVLLDEPTADTDPVARRRIWEILSRRNPKQAIVLTSHTMSECEAVCDRLTVMVDGEMKCLGAVHELKNTFGKSCTLRVTLGNNTTPKQLDVILQKILKDSKFSPYAELQEKQMNMLTINIKTDKVNIKDIFAGMLKIKEQNPSIEDFSLTETPLEEIFTSFAKQNSPGSKKSPVKKKY